MLYEKYEKILKHSERVDWYETEVPRELLTPLVINVASNIIEQINRYDDSGVDNKPKKDYIESLWENVRNLPYTLNGDFYLKKKIEIEGKVKPKKVKDVKTTKNSQRIFGNK
jgi:hypothetical protein